MHLRRAGRSGALKAFTELLFKTWALRFLPLCQLCFVSPSSRAAPGKSFAQPKAQPMDSHQNSPSLRPLRTFCPSESDGSILPSFTGLNIYGVPGMALGLLDIVHTTEGNSQGSERV